MARNADSFPPVGSWINSKVAKGGSSPIEGRGVHAIENIPRGTIVAVKGGHILDAAAVVNLPGRIRNSAFPISADHFLAAVSQDEYDDVMMLVNHSCDPNVGMGGNVLLVSMRDIAVGEELTIDYAMFIGDGAWTMNCRCPAPSCRKVVTGADWMRPDLQARYEGWFSWWLQRRITQTARNPDNYS